MNVGRSSGARNPVRYFTLRSFNSIALALLLVLTLGIDLPYPQSAAAAPAKDKKQKQDASLKGLPITELSADEAILHALNRLAYGPRPGDVERVRQMGLAKWIDQQLNPNSIDDKAVEARLENFPTLRMSTSKLLGEYPQPKQAEKQAIKRAQAGLNRAEVPAITSVKDDASPPREQSVVGAQPHPERSDAAPQPTSQKMEATGPAPAAQATQPSAPSPMKQETSDAANLATRGAGKRDLLGGDPNAVPRAIADDSRRPARVVEELAMAKMTRAIYSERQLQQILDDFWFNHFNIFAGKGADRWLLTSYERDVIQPHTFGKFKDLVLATAKSPAMLFYLDNFLSADPNAAARFAAERAARQGWHRGPFGRPGAPRPQQSQQKKNARGLNENYGRELMELHTLGVDGGYTQKDVTEVARCFTGWTIERPRESPSFKFDERLHDPAPKMVLGKKIHAGGMKDGEEVIDLLARHPSTAKFISTKLARRFVSDNPPQALIERMARTFESNDGDIRAVMKTMIESPEFWSREAYHAKIKTPFELVVSTARALGTDVDTPMPLVQWTARIGQPLYQCQPPTGYSDKAEAWVNTGALLNRLNYSLALAGNRVRGSRTDVPALFGIEASGDAALSRTPNSKDARSRLLGTDSNDAKSAVPGRDSNDAKVALQRAVQVFLGGQIAPGTLETLEKQLDTPEILQARLDDPVRRVDLGIVAGLVLGAPEFQRR